MEKKTPQNKLMKRPADDDHQRHTKRPMTSRGDEHFIFRVLLPNGTALPLRFSVMNREMRLGAFIKRVKEEHHRSAVRISDSASEKLDINWDDETLHLVDIYENKIRGVIDLSQFEPQKCHILRLIDGHTSGEAITYQNMWDLTPDTDLLLELPEEYNFETALADLIDNSLQAVWSNKPTEGRLISVKIDKEKIRIFDSGPGMDGTHENSISKWGKMGASLHRVAKGNAVGGKPPYLMPFFGMFGYGGPVASMHLGRRALVSSKTKKSKKVYWLTMERESLINSNAENMWKTEGGIRNPKKGEIDKSPHGSFTMVEIFEPRMKCLNIKQLQCRLKDIYFPYIQCDELSKNGKTVMPIEFQVNGTDLAEVESGEVAVANLLSCKGPDFTFLLHFSQEKFSTGGHGFTESIEANARLKCVYFPIIQGKESIDMILKKLEKDGCGISENFTNFSRVCVRRLGRLLPDARWAWLPFMEPKPRRGVKGQTMKRCCYRVKCFIDTDSGFNPNPSKTHLAHHHAFTVALKSFGSRLDEKEKDVRIKIIKDGIELNVSKLEKQYEDWILRMHGYDEEIESGQEDEATVVLGLSNKGELGTSSDVVRVYRHFRRKGVLWDSGQKIKILKGACAGFHHANVFATLEYIIVEGLDEDACGEARLICRPMGVPEIDGCILSDNNGNPSIEIRKSVSVPINIIDSGKCVAVDDSVWHQVLQMRTQKNPSSIDLLSGKACKDLGVEGELSFDTVDAGFTPPREIVAVVRPPSFDAGLTSQSIDQKSIVVGNFTMTVDINFRADFAKKNENVKNLFSGSVTPVSRKGYHGLYICSPRKEVPKLFQEAGQYTFVLTLKELSLNLERSVRVRALSQVGSWQCLEGQLTAKICTRVGSCFPPISIGSYDKYKNRNPFPRDTEVKAKVNSSKGLNADVKSINQYFSSDNYKLTIEDMLVESNELDKIRPEYEATLSLLSCDEQLAVNIPCQVMPGAPKKVCFSPNNFGENLIPGQIIQDFVLEIFDTCGNHAKEDEHIVLKLDGFCIHDRRDLHFKVDSSGRVDLSGLLRVVAGYNKKVSFSVLSNDDVVYKKEFQTEIRKLRAAFQVPLFGSAGTQLENIAFEVTDRDGEVDESIHNEDGGGQSHTLKLSSDLFTIDNSLRYSFVRGRCKIQNISLPLREGIFSFEATHSQYPELNYNVEVRVEQAVYLEKQNVITPCSKEKNLLIPNPSGLVALNLEYSDRNDQFLDGRTWTTPDWSMPPKARAEQAVYLEKQNVLTPCSKEKNLHLQHPSGLVSLKQEYGDRNDQFSDGRTFKTPDWSMPPKVRVEQAHYLEKQNVLTPRSKEKNLHLQHPSGLVALKPEYGDRNDQFSDGRKLKTPDWSMPPKVGCLVKCENNYLQELEADLCKYGRLINQHEGNLKALTLQQSTIEQEIISLRAGLDLDYNQDGEAASEVEFLLDKISYSGDSAAAVACRLLQSETESDRWSWHIMGVVASLGTVQTNDLSRIFSKYLGEDQMLAIVCASHADAANLEKYAPDGEVTDSKGLHGLAADLGMSIKKPFTVICLDKISPYTGEIGSDPQQKLALPDPVMSNGKPPLGYLGYAVNMINIHGRHLSWMSASGHGLRATLFYRIFGSVQVYENRKYMFSATSCIQDGAVSLDGGIMKGNGVITLGHRGPDIQFPVVSAESQRSCSSPAQVELVKRIEDKKQELRETASQIQTEAKAHEKDMKEFNKKKEAFEKVLDEEEQLMLQASPCKLSMDTPPKLFPC